MTAHAYTSVGCQTTYHPNYAIHKDERAYFPGIPEHIQVAEHVYVETRVLKLFTALALLSWTSSTNAAHVYHLALSQLDSNRDSVALFQLRPEHLWDGFVILALLKDASERNYSLRVPNSGDQADRFTAATDARNEFMRCAGQTEYNHWCTKCVRRFEPTEEGQPAGKTRPPESDIC